MHLNVHVIEGSLPRIAHLVLETEAHQSLLSLALVDEYHGHPRVTEEFHRYDVITGPHGWYA